MFFQIWLLVLVGNRCLEPVAQHESWFCSVGHWPRAVLTAPSSPATHCCASSLLQCYYWELTSWPHWWPLTSRLTSDPLTLTLFVFVCSRCWADLRQAEGELPHTSCSGAPWWWWLAQYVQLLWRVIDSCLSEPNAWIRTLWIVSRPSSQCDSPCRSAHCPVQKLITMKRQHELRQESPWASLGLRWPHHSPHASQDD